MIRANIISQFEARNFKLKEIVQYYQDNDSIFSLFFIYNDLCLILDVNICNYCNKIFSYSDYTNKQNEYMFNYNQCYRFYIENESDIEEAIVTFFTLIREDTYLEINENYRYVNRNESHPDNTPLESFFEECFEEVYGTDSKRYLEKEYPLIDIYGNNIFVDYVVEKKGDKKIAVEENGLQYHHPQLIGVDKYKKQLDKQNSLVHYNFTIFRWSLEHLKFKDKVCESIRKYFGEKDNFIDKTDINVTRKYQLYEHQNITLKEIDLARKEGVSSFLIVLPTATGKSRIIEEDINRLLFEDINYRFLIMVPTIRIKEDWINRIKELLKQSKYQLTYGDDKDCQFFITTYISAYKYVNILPTNYFDYIVIDEAHHAVAPTVRKTIQYFNPKFLVGLTATPQRLDKKRLEDIFGTYKEKISLQEAIEKNIISPIRAYRIESNINLSEVRFNGKDYYNTDLEKLISVESRNELIAKVLKRYFVDSSMPYKQGIIFCVNISHTKRMEKILNSYGISAKAVNGIDPNSQKYIEEYNNQKIQFLCACNLLSEGWDSPQTSILVMARPTLSKVLYLQQLGRGLRKHHDKECLYVIDVVDQYGAFNAPWSVHGIFNNPYYIPFGDILNRQVNSNEMLIIEGLVEEPIAIREIDIFTFEQKYQDYLSLEQLARELFVSTGTVRNWLNKKEVIADVELQFGNRKIQMFKPERVNEIRNLKGLKEHNEDTIKEDFWEFIEEKSYTFSFKMVFLLAFLKSIDANGNAKIDDILKLYRRFYLERIENSVKVDRPNCIYTKEFLNDTKALKQNMLDNPFEKFERKRFIYYCKDLSEIGFNVYLWDKLTYDDLIKLKQTMKQHLNEYYQNYDGLLNIDYLL